MIKGLVIGKFYPPHKGHEYLINYAFMHCDYLDVVVCDLPGQKIEAKKRAKWIQKTFPKANVRVVFDLGKDDDSLAWANYTREFLGYSPGIVFTSEDYGHLYSKYLDAKHILVDLERVNVPISATKIRNNLYSNFDWLLPAAKADLIPRVVILGAESTGTTTLAIDLAKHYGSFLPLEYGRFYSEGKLYSDSDWNSGEFEYIAEMQNSLEHQFAKLTKSKVLICDTDSFATELWHNRYLNYYSQALREISETRRVTLYILTGDEIPFVQDGTRDGESIRHEMHDEFIKVLNERGYPFILVRGSCEERLKMSIDKIDNLLNKTIFD